MHTNRTLVTELILLGFSTDVKTNQGLFVLYLVIYVISLLGNSLIICIFLKKPPLHIPMYFFLCILSILDLCMSTAAVPRLLYDLLTAHKVISIVACKIQFFVIIFIGGTESVLLALMAYDRFLAICHPLRYQIQMRWSVCYRLTALVCIINFMVFIIMPQAIPVAFCNPNRINHFMCELLAIIQLACDSIFVNEVIMPITCFMIVFLPFIYVIVSYIYIITSVLKLQSTRRSKAFSTCTSHIIVVLLAYGSSMLIYFSPSAQYSRNQGKYLSMFSCIVCPALNPIIYSLNNKEVKDTLKKFLTRCHLSCRR